MKRKLLRPYAALFPPTLLASAVFGDQALTLRFLGAYFALQIASLCAPVAFCNAAAREPAMRRLGRRFWGGLTQLFLGAALLFCALRLVPLPFDARDGEILIAALLVLIEQMFEERMTAVSRSVDATLLALISGVFVLLGLVLTAEGTLPNSTPLRYPYLLGGCVLSALLGAVLTLLLAGGRGFTPLPINYGFAPKAMAQELLYPALIAAAVVWGKTEPTLPAVLTGWMLWRAIRSVCRRTRGESKAPDWFLCIVSAALSLLAYLFPTILPYALCASAVLLCAMAVYLAPSPRLYVFAAVAFALTVLSYLHPFEI